MISTVEQPSNATPANGEHTIDVRGVTKTYKNLLGRNRVAALRGVDMAVRSGEVFGLLGPNGAGKSTLVKVMLTIASADRLEGSVLGRRVGDKRALNSVGYLPEHHRVPPYLTGAQSMMLFGGLFGMPRKERKARSEVLLDRVGIAAAAGRKVGGYSKGMRQRLGIALALINNPKLVVLDEPTDGVDPIGRRQIREIVATLKDEGKTVFLNSHLLSELEMVCDRVAIMVRGRVRKLGTLEDLTLDRASYRVTLETNAEDCPISLEGIGNDAAWDAATKTIELNSTAPSTVQPIIDRARTNGLSIVEVHRHRPSLEDLFITAVEEDDAERTMQREPS